MVQKRPLLLVTNDDGVQSDGIAAIASALEPIGDVIVVAPSRQQSAVSHGISLSQPLRVRTVGAGRFAVSGTPADAVFLGLAEIAPRRPDLVVSGINHGANIGTDVFYSGTLAAALEATMQGIPAIAVSQMLPMVNAAGAPADESEERQKASAWDPLEHLGHRLEELLQHTARFAAAVVQDLLRSPLPEGVVLSINAPDRAATAFQWTRLGRRLFRQDAIRRVDPRGVPYYWVTGLSYESDLGHDTDSAALASGAFSLTPLGLDWTARVPQPSTLRLDGYRRLDGYGRLDGNARGAAEEGGDDGSD